MQLKSVLVNTTEYKAAVAIRIVAFFKDMPNAAMLINDAYEAKAEHIVGLEEGIVIGTGRLHVANGEGVISQMAVAISHKNKGVGTCILKKCMAICKAKGITTVTLAARCTALEFYKRFNFEVTGDVYPSKKTGILHQNMRLHL